MGKGLPNTISLPRHPVGLLVQLPEVGGVHGDGLRAGEAGAVPVAEALRLALHLAQARLRRERLHAAHARHERLLLVARLAAAFAFVFAVAREQVLG